MPQQMTPEQFEAWKAEGARKYEKDVRKAAAKLREPSEREKAIIAVAYPGWRTSVETLMDAQINEGILKNVAKIIEVSETPNRVTVEFTRAELLGLFDDVLTLPTAIGPRLTARYAIIRATANVIKELD